MESLLKFQEEEEAIRHSQEKARMESSVLRAIAMGNSRCSISSSSESCCRQRNSSCYKHKDKRAKIYQKYAKLSDLLREANAEELEEHTMLTLLGVVTEFLNSDYRAFVKTLTDNEIIQPVAIHIFGLLTEAIE